MGGVGHYKVTVDSRADGGLSDQTSFSTDVVGMADVELEVNELRRFVDVGDETAFRIRIKNIGTKEARRILVKAVVSKNIVPFETNNGTDDPTKALWNPEQLQLIFPEIDHLDPGKEIVMGIKVRAEGGLGTCHVYLLHDELTETEPLEDMAHIRITAPRRRGDERGRRSRRLAKARGPSPSPPPRPSPARGEGGRKHRDRRPSLPLPPRGGGPGWGVSGAEVKDLATLLRAAPRLVPGPLSRRIDGNTDGRPRPGPPAPGIDTRNATAHPREGSTAMPRFRPLPPRAGRRNGPFLAMALAPGLLVDRPRRGGRAGGEGAGEPTGEGDQPVPAAARPQPGRLVSLGAGGVREGEGRGQADLPVGRLQLVLLVPRHGAGELPGPGDRRRSQRALRLHQGRPRGAARRRPGLHDRLAGVRQRRRLADVDVPDPRRPAVLRRDVLPARRPRRLRGLPGRAQAGGRGLARPPAEIERDADRLAELVRRSLEGASVQGRCRSRATWPRWAASSWPSSSTPSTAASASTPRMRDGPSSPSRSTSSSCSTSTAASAGAKRSRRRAGPDPLAMVVTTLDHMARGGIRDQLAGGYHRYATSRYWIVPHFEKMLYDNAQLASVHPARLRGDRRRALATEAEATFAFVARTMTAPEGGFYSALDAETEGEEGQSYVWTRDEVESVLGAVRTTTRSPRSTA